MAGEIEPSAVSSFHREDGPETSIRSIAISLKRIADALEVQNEYGEGPAEAIGGNIKRALLHR